MDKRQQQCVHFYRGTCQRGEQCRYEHQVGDDGRPVPVGPEILQRFDEAVKIYNENRAQAQAKPKAAPRGGVSSSMIVLEPDEVEHWIVLSAAQALDNDQYYAMLDSGTNAIIVPWHPGMQGEIAECQVPSATVTGPALPNSAILVSQESLTTIAGWTFVSGPKPGLKNSVCENKVYPAGADSSSVLSMKNGLPYLSNELFWRAMEDVAGKAKLTSGHKWSELKDMIDNRAYETQPQVYSVKTVAVPETPKVLLSAPPGTHHFIPNNVRKQIVSGLNTSTPLQIPIEVVFLEQPHL